MKEIQQYVNSSSGEKVAQLQKEVDKLKKLLKGY